MVNDHVHDIELYHRSYEDAYGRPYHGRVWYETGRYVFHYGEKHTSRDRRHVFRMIERLNSYANERNGR